ncbi:hypothetical protein AVEN_113151-1 [Araneus ventricosus]|uniref:Integrase catalytic domain-containing protein n=1 Tax=Araneus ventricosus TaxID=182803 RepID=A0A4Y2NK50_ARAVE|nr:hypothetical protein AVEN_113151-1 [Araneus ventricosus]
MADLPRSRVQTFPVFSRGTDYAGPFPHQTPQGSRYRSVTSVFSSVLQPRLFIEIGRRPDLVSSAALKRFIAGGETPQKSNTLDCGTNFIAAETEKSCGFFKEG